MVRCEIWTTIHKDVLLYYINKKKISRMDRRHDSTRDRPLCIKLLELNDHNYSTALPRPQLAIEVSYIGSHRAIDASISTHLCIHITYGGV